MYTAIISALIGIIAALLGAWAGAAISRKSANDIMRKQEFNKAASKLRAAFSPAKAHLKFPQSLGNTDAREFFDSIFTNHAIAIEEFRPFAKDNAAYQIAWEDYQNTVYGDDALADADLKWNSGLITPSKEIGNIPFLPYIDKKIDNILQSAPIF